MVPPGTALRLAFGKGRRRFEASLLGRWWARLLDLQFVDRAVALAAKAFVAFLPAVLALAAIAPEEVRLGMAETLERRLGLSGQSLELVQSSLASGQSVSNSTSVLSMILVLFYATTFTSALQRVYLSAWQRPAVRDRVREVKGLVWLVGVIVLLTLFSALKRTFSGLVGASLVLAAGFLALVGLWWATSYVMLRGHLRWRVLLPSALAMALGASVYTAGATVWVPRSMIANQQQFGFFGVSMTLVSWFVGFCFVIVAAAALGPVLATDEGPIGRLVRGPQEGLLRPGAPPSVPFTGSPTPLWRGLAPSSDPEAT
jgi:membrane protein